MKKRNAAVLNMMPDEVIMDVNMFCTRVIMRVFGKDETALVLAIQRSTGEWKSETA